MTVFGGKNIKNNSVFSTGILASMIIFVVTILSQIFMTYISEELYIWWRYPDAVMIDSRLSESDQIAILKKARSTIHQK